MGTKASVLIMQERIIDRLTKWMSEHSINDNQLTNMAGLSVGLLGNSRKKDATSGKKLPKKSCRPFRI